MNISTEYKISLTQDELNRIVAAHCGFPLDSKIVLTVVPTDGEWIDVPSGWEHEHCPTEYSDGTKIDIMFRDGLIENCVIGDYHDCWVQDQNSWNIVKYRVSKG